MLGDGRKEGQEERRQQKAREEPSTGQGDAGNRWCLQSAAKAASPALQGTWCLRSGWVSAGVRKAGG